MSQNLHIIILYHKETFENLLFLLGNRTHHNNLHDAIKHADVKELQRLIQQGCPINGVDAKFKFAPIHWAVHYGSIEVLCSIKLI